MKKHLILFFCLFIVSICNIKADGYLVVSIPENLKMGANAVIRESEELFRQQDMRNGSYKITYIITILNEKGSHYADFYTYEDSFRELSGFSGEIFNAAGKTIKKIGKKDLVTTAFSTDLATDARQIFYKYHTPSYPFTIKYEYEIKYKNGILRYPSFDPVPGTEVSIEHSNYTLQIPQDFTLRYKAQSLMSEPEKSLVKNDSIFKWTLDSFEPLPYERFMPVSEIYPQVLLSPAKFCVYNNCGDMSTWENFGKWQEGLLIGRNSLPKKDIDKIRELTNGITDKREKVKRVYEYLQSTTHYVSIQLGIGGWQPIPVENVAKAGFGDCKALSNYMMSMLEAVDISSYYVVIGMNRKRFFKDFPSFGQSDHVILMVPLEKDSVWLECTSQLLPFGYIHNGIAGNDALAVGRDKSFFCTLPSNPPSGNQELNKVDIQLDGAGRASLKVHSAYKMEEYEDIMYKTRGLNSKEEGEFASGFLKVHKPRISQFRKEETRTEQPCMDIYYSADCEDYASLTASRMLIPVNPVKLTTKGFLSGSSRRFDIVFESSVFQSDTINIRVPEGYVLEQKPKTTDITSAYGFLKSYFSQDGNMLKYIQTLEIKPGRYPASQYEDLKRFFSQVDSFQGVKVGLKKE